MRRQKAHTASAAFFYKIGKKWYKRFFQSRVKVRKSILASDLDTAHLENKLFSTKKIINIGKGKKEASYLPKSKKKQLFLAGYWKREEHFF